MQFPPSAIRSLTHTIIMPTQDTPAFSFNLPEGFEIPQGFAVRTIGTSNQPVLIPYYMVPALQQMLQIDEEKKKPNITKASAKVPASFSHVQC